MPEVKSSQTQPPAKDAPTPASASGDAPPELEGAAKIKAIVAEIPKDTPDSHVMFGYGNHKVTIGDLKKI